MTHSPYGMPATNAAAQNRSVMNSASPVGAIPSQKKPPVNDNVMKVETNRRPWSQRRLTGGGAETSELQAGESWWGSRGGGGLGRCSSKAVSVARRNYSEGLLAEVPEVLAWFETDRLSRRNTDLAPGSRVPADALLAWFDLKHTETS